MVLCVVAVILVVVAVGVVVNVVDVVVGLLYFYCNEVCHRGHRESAGRYPPPASDGGQAGPSSHSSHRCWIHTVRPHHR